MRRMKWFVMLPLLLAILTGCQAVENEEGFFYSTFVKPMDVVLDFFGNDLFNGSYGLAIIAITLIIRIILLPFMLRTYKSQSMMKVKMDTVRPLMEDIQARMKTAQTQEEKLAIQNEMMTLYKEHNINPLNMGCLPMLIQMPIIMGLYFAILYSGDVKTHTFLWFDLGTPDIFMTIIAGIVYFIQAKVTMWTVTESQQAQMKWMMYFSPIMIVIISFTSMAALPLYWSISGLFLIIQTIIGRKYFTYEPELEEVKQEKEQVK